MSLELTVRGKKYKVDVDSRGNFFASLDQDDGARQLTADTLKGLEQKLTAATRARSAKVALKLKRLGRKPEYNYRGSSYSYSYHHDDEIRPWEVIEVTVRGVNEHTGHLMVTWPDGAKGDDEKIGRWNVDKSIYFPLEMADEEILRRRNLIDETEAWMKANSVDAMGLARKAVAKALGEEK